MKKIIGILTGLLIIVTAFSQKAAPKPLYDDPVYHGAADPVIVYNKSVKKWWMFYTNRRASITDSTVAWVHGTRIGIAESKDGRVWKYVDTANINYRPDPGYTHWAPDIIEENGSWHMYLTYVPGTFTDWNHPRVIVHLHSTDLINWSTPSTSSTSSAPSTLQLINQKVIDASVYKVNDSLYRLWYNNEKDGKSIWYAESKDLYHWTDKGKAIAARGEGPKVFYWQDQYFMIVDAWKGMEVYSSTDLLKWTKQKDRILEAPGKGKDDQAIGGHCEVIVNDGRAFVYYFTHPGRRKDKPAAKGSFDDKRSVIQVAELEYKDGQIVCDRDKPLRLKLKRPE
ncbi:MAG TPA: family 43 glycosylhydrolase [Chitinophagaceae bacterium]|nr:family 43 glycosylhydrolase [Chitinophagaceae bacterium]